MRVFSVKDVHENITAITQILASGGVLVCPSDTTYGLLVDATNEKAVEKLVKLKSRPRGKPISIFVDGWDMMEKYVDVSNLTPEVRSLLPGSYTIVLPSSHTTSSLLGAEDGTMGVRYIDHPVIAEIVQAFGKPLTATSANVSGGGLCYSPDAFLNQLSEVKRGLVDALVDAGELPHNPPSTVIHLGGHTPMVLRANDQNYVHHETYVVKNEEETAMLAQKVFELVQDFVSVKPIVILLDGELGSGKTTWTKYFAEHFGVSGIVSPTYTYECEYETHGPEGITRFKHYDLYNITNPEDVAYLEIEKHCTTNTISCIEWSGQLSHEERVRLANSTYLVRILFEYVGEKERKVEVWWN